MLKNKDLLYIYLYTRFRSTVYDFAPRTNSSHYNWWSDFADFGTEHHINVFTEDMPIANELSIVATTLETLLGYIHLRADYQ